MRQMIAAYVEPYYGVHGNVPLDVDGHISYSYLFTPVYRMENVAYDDLRFKDEQELEDWKSYNDVNVDFHRIQLNNYISVNKNQIWHSH